LSWTISSSWHPEVPIKSTANELGLKLHQIDTFKGWEPPSSINLVVAVSFGLLVPARILNGAKYGGLNVHPSLLPDLRGPAPLQHTLLKRREYTGVTVQTMHPTKFDHGSIVAQTSQPGVQVPHACKVEQLLHLMGPVGAQLLCQSVERGLFAQSVNITAISEPIEVDHAPKIITEDSRIDWQNWDAQDIQLRDRVLGRLWEHRHVGRTDEVAKRIVYHGPWQIETPGEESYTSNASEHHPPPGDPILSSTEITHEPKLGFRTADGLVAFPSSATIDGGKKGAGLRTLISWMRKGWPRECNAIWLPASTMWAIAI
jgi:methionyl-tRNA formyltransferase